MLNFIKQTGIKGIGGVTFPMMTDAYTGMIKQEIAQASVGTRLMQNIGGAFGSAVLATVVSLSIQYQMSSSYLGFFFKESTCLK